MKIALSDGSGNWFETDTATYWEEATWWNGNNHISHATGSQWEHERLYFTAHGGFVLNCWSQWQGTPESYEQIDASEAARWLVKNSRADDLDELPESVRAEVEKIVEGSEV